MTPRGCGRVVRRSVLPRAGPALEPFVPQAPFAQRQKGRPEVVLNEDELPWVAIKKRKCAQGGTSKDL